MDSSFALYLGRQALETTMLLSAPVLITCMVVGVLITLLQAVTSIRDMTLTTVPKLLAVGVVILFFGQWSMRIMVTFFHEIFFHIQHAGP